MHRPTNFTDAMTNLILILMLFILTFNSRVQVRAPSIKAAKPGKARRIVGALERRLRHVAIGATALVAFVALVAHDAQAPSGTLTAGAQDEMAWVAANTLPQGPDAFVTASVDSTPLREGE